MVSATRITIIGSGSTVFTLSLCSKQGDQPIILIEGDKSTVVFSGEDEMGKAIENENDEVVVNTEERQSSKPHTSEQPARREPQEDSQPQEGKWQPNFEELNRESELQEDRKGKGILVEDEVHDSQPFTLLDQAGPSSFATQQDDRECFSQQADIEAGELNRESNPQEDRKGKGKMVEDDVSASQPFMLLDKENEGGQGQENQQADGGQGQENQQEGQHNEPTMMDWDFTPLTPLKRGLPNDDDVEVQPHPNKKRRLSFTM